MFRIKNTRLGGIWSTWQLFGTRWTNCRNIILLFVWLSSWIQILIHLLHSNGMFGSRLYAGIDLTKFGLLHFKTWFNVDFGLLIQDTGPLILISHNFVKAALDLSLMIILLECHHIVLSMAADLVWIGHCLCQISLGC